MRNEQPDSFGERTSATVRLKEPAVVSSLCEAGSPLTSDEVAHFSILQIKSINLRWIKLQIHKLF